MKTKPKIAVVGTFHMGPTSDLFKTDVDDLLSDKRQQEILEVVELLQEFNPTKVAIEFEKKRNERTNQEYTDFLAGEYELKVNEVDQIAFRLAAAMNHKEVYCIDWMEQGARKRDAGDVYEWAKDNQPEQFEEIFGWLPEAMGQVNSEKSILAMLQDLNLGNMIERSHRMNLNIARIKSDEDYVGMDWLVWWYQRNLIMFSNLADLAESPDDRILMLVGSSHVNILANFLEESGVFDVVPIEQVLGSRIKSK